MNRRDFLVTAAGAAACALVSVPAPPVPPAPGAPVPGRWYRVQAGDTLEAVVYAAAALRVLGFDTRVSLHQDRLWWIPRLEVATLVR